MTNNILKILTDELNHIDERLKHHNELIQTIHKLKADHEEFISNPCTHPKTKVVDNRGEMSLTCRCCGKILKQAYSYEGLLND